jgi:hypothetical protein
MRSLRPSEALPQVSAVRLKNGTKRDERQMNVARERRYRRQG